MEKLKKKTGRRLKAGHAEMVAARQLKAIQLRRSGASYQQISEACGVSVMQSFRDVRAAREATIQCAGEEAAALVATELDRLDGLLVRLARGINAGHVPAIREARRISESRRKLLGLDDTKPQEIIVNPAPVERDEFAGVSTADLLAKMASAAEVLRALDDARATLPQPPEPAPPPTLAELYALELEQRRAGR